MATTSAHCIIECSDQPLDISFHPIKPYILAAGLVDGTVEVHDFEELLKKEEAPKGAVASARRDDDDDDSDDDDDEIDTIVSSTAVHSQILPSKTSESRVQKASCRTVHFSLDGSVLYTGGSAGDLVSMDASRITTFDMTKQKKAILWKCENAAYGKGGVQVIHEFRQQKDPGQVELAEVQMENHFRTILATGDEVGGVRLWDTRLMSQKQYNSTPNTSLKRPPGCIHSWKVHDDFISGFINSEDGNTLIASSADCRISVYDLRMASQNMPQDKVVRTSDDQEDELLSIQLMKHGRKVVCGTGEGVLSIFSYGTWGDCSDRFPGHPASVDALLSVDEDTLLTGSSDGLIRVCSIFPNKLIGVLGDHEGFPIEKLRINCDRKYVGSVTHDLNIRLWDARILHDDYDDEMEHDPLPETKNNSTDLNLKSDGSHNSEDDWEGMDEELGSDNEEEEDDSDSDDSEGKPNTKKGKSKTVNDKRKNRFKTEQEKFFDDL